MADMVDLAARAMFDRQKFRFSSADTADFWAWEKMDRHTRDHYTDLARAALSALRSAGALMEWMDATAEIARLRGLLERARASLVECAVDLADHIDASHEFRADYPHIMEKYKRDMEPVESARSIAKEIEQELM